MCWTSALVLLLTFTTTILLPAPASASVVERPKPGTLPKGEVIPPECCATFCFPIEIGCHCCFENYEYFDGIERKRVDGVPEWLKAKQRANNKTPTAQ